MGLSGSGGSDWDDTGMAAFTLFYVIFCTGIYFQFKVRNKYEKTYFLGQGPQLYGTKCF